VLSVPSLFLLSQLIEFLDLKLRAGAKPVPTFAVVNTADEIAPLNSIKPFADAMAKNLRVVEYPGELGVCLQHLGILVGRHAQAHVWPEIVSWLKSLSGDMAKPGLHGLPH
jgi:hypothetical protein